MKSKKQTDAHDCWKLAFCATKGFCEGSVHDLSESILLMGIVARPVATIQYYRAADQNLLIGSSNVRITG